MVAAASQYLVNVSTSGIHNFKVECGAMPTYGMSKNSGTLLLQQVAKDVSPDRMQVNSFHPGSIFTEASVGGGYTPENLDADDENLPGQHAVWLASPEARFLHGRFVASHWDVDELRSAETAKLLEDFHFLRVGVVGLYSIGQE